MRSHALPQQALFTVSGVRKLCMWSSKDKSSTSVEKTYIISIKHIRTATDRIKHEELPKHDYKCRMNGQQLRPSGIWHTTKRRPIFGSITQLLLSGKTFWMHQNL